MKLTQDGKWKRVDYFTGKKPETSGVYALVVNKDILYIGSTCNFKQRLAYHEVVRRICDDKNISDGITVFMRETRDYRKIEIELIKTYSPDYNTAWTARRLENKPKKKKFICGINFSEEMYVYIIELAQKEKRNFYNMVDILCTEAIQARERNSIHQN